MMADTYHPAHSALLHLVKAQTRPADQAREAANILGIDLGALQNSSKQDVAAGFARSRPFAPKEEWILRWLLKKMRVDEEGSHEYRINYDVWTLISTLLGTLPPKIVAKLLLEHGFMQSLSEALRETFDSHNPDDTRLLPERSLRSDSSSTLQESPALKPQQRGKTRNRVGAPREEPPSDHAPRKPGLLPEAAQIFLAAQQVVQLTTSHGNPDEVSRHQMQAALKVDPDIVAKIMGGAYLIVNQILSKSGTSDSEETSKLLRFLGAVAKLWDMRPTTGDDSKNSKSNAAFSSNCVLPALELIDILSESTAPLKIIRQECVKQLERLIARHVVVPTRASYFAFSQRKTRDLEIDVSHPAVDVILNELQTFQGIEGKETAIGTINPHVPGSRTLPRLLDIALRAAPRRSLKQQSNESPWLETLFVALSEIAGFSTRDASPAMTPQSVKPLEELLSVAINGRLPLSLKLLYYYTSKYSRVFDDTTVTFAKTYDDRLSPCEWSLLAKITRLGVDIFIPNSGITEARSLLNATFKKATILRLGPSTRADNYYYFIKANVILPIMQGFAQARDVGTFVDLWCNQLNIFFERFTEKDLRKASGQFSIWESEDMIMAFAGLVPSSFTSDQMKAQYDHAIHDLRAIDHDQMSFNRAMSWTVVMDALLRLSLIDGSYSSSTESIVSLGQVTAMLLSTLSGRGATHRWRLWRILRYIAEHATPALDKNSAKDSSILTVDYSVPQIMQDVLSLAKTPKWQDLAQAFEAFQYLVIAMVKTGRRQDTAIITNAIKLMTATLGNDPHSKDDLASLKWDGRVQTLDSRLNLSLAYAAALVTTPESLGFISSPVRQALLRALYSLARVSSENIKGSNLESQRPAFRSIWVGLATQESISRSKSLWEDFIQVQVSEIEQHGVENAALDVLARVSAESVSRPHREKILDSLLDALLESGNRSQQPPVSELMALMIRFLDLVNPTARLLTDAGALWDVIEGINPIDFDTDTCTILEDLTASVLNLLRISQSKQRALDYFTAFLRRISLSVRKHSSFCNEFPSLSLLKTSIPLLWSWREDMFDTSSQEELANVRQKFTAVLILDLKLVRQGKASLSSTDSDSLVYSAVNSLGQLKDLVGEDKGFSDLLTQVAVESAEKRILLPSAPTNDVRERRDIISNEIAVNETLFEIGAPSLSTALENLMGVLSSPILDIRTHQKALQAAKRMVTQSNEDDALSFMSSLSFRNAPPGKGQAMLLILGIVISSLEYQIDKGSSVSISISSLFGDLALQLPFVSSIEDFCLITDCLDLILRGRPRCVSQRNVDNTLSMIASATAESGLGIDCSDANVLMQNAGIIFSRLCRLMGSILVIHRKQVGGRFHLVVAALQGLMRCLFVPERSRALSTSTVLPSWIPSGKEVLGREHALQYTRILTTICDPTVSSVKKSRSSQAHQLTDETKKARGVAGQYLQYLVREYAQSQLHGRVSPEVKAALMPGLYAVLDAMSREGMRAMNAAMDSSSRAIFKGLYDDYRRFGKWDQT